MGVGVELAMGFVIYWGRLRGHMEAIVLFYLGQSRTMSVIHGFSVATEQPFLPCKN